jgi:hypothetical protein
VQVTDDQLSQLMRAVHSRKAVAAITAPVRSLSLGERSTPTQRTLA